MKLKSWYGIGFVAGVIAAFAIGVTVARTYRAPLIQPVKVNISQNAFNYIKTKDANRALITPQAQAKLVKTFLYHNFLPWNNAHYFTQFTLNGKKINIKNLEMKNEQYYLKSPGYGMNYQRYSKKWIKRIVNNINWSVFKAQGRNAIIIANTNLRILPTADPSYFPYTEAGQGYPFDNLQYSSLWIGQPIKVMMKARNDEWAFVVSSGWFGWIKVVMSLAKPSLHNYLSVNSYRIPQAQC